MDSRNNETIHKNRYMSNFLKLEPKERLLIFEQIRSKTGLVEAAIEKDWWVTQTLSIIFSIDCAPHLVFKGGTSLSKAWGLIQRFSEDIDLALNRQLLGFEVVSNKTQVNKLRKKSFEYISTVFYPELKQKFEVAGINGLNIILTEAKDPDQDPLIIEIYYPSVTKTSNYLNPRIVVEIGSHSLIDPFTNKLITSLVGESYSASDFADKAISIPVVNPERTFLEKIFLLHEEFQKPHDKIRVDRLSRHLYDIEKMMDSEFAAIALANEKLYNNIVLHRSLFNGIGGTDYANHIPAKINFLPPISVIKEWQKDYEIMQENMIYGESLSFENLLVRLESLQQVLNAKG